MRIALASPHPPQQVVKREQEIRFQFQLGGRFGCGDQRPTVGIELAADEPLTLARAIAAIANARRSGNSMIDRHGPILRMRCPVNDAWIWPSTT
ncbi:MAG TPA: hypothetical protein VH352_26730 [Pseudonocardiaceae bacterium]|nr:hypothetical protein [Pseudonocardiaceae bacterium]